MLLKMNIQHLTKQSELPNGITLEQVTRFAATAIIVNDQNQVLMMMRDDCPAWINIGGLVDADEGFEQALHREVMEEAGVEIDIVQFSRNYFTPSSRTPLSDFLHDKTYLCQIKEGQNPVLGDEGVALAWFDLEDLPKNIPPRSLIRMADAKDQSENRPRAFTEPSTTNFIQTCPVEGIHMLDFWKKHPRVLQKKSQGKLRYWPE